MFFIHLAIGHELDALGLQHETKREPSESDDSYRRRIVAASQPAPVGTQEIDLVMLEKSVYSWVLHHGTPKSVEDFLKSAGTVVDALRRGNYLRTSPSPAAVMWRCKDYADGWIVFRSQSDAEAYRDATGSVMQALGVIDSIETLTLRSRIKELIAEYGSLRGVSRVLGIDVGYLSRLKHGIAAHPSGEVLTKLGLREVTRYERTTDAAPKS